MCETDLESITATLQEERPGLAIIDSIQTMYSAQVQASPGSIAQIREATGILLRLAKETGITFFLVGHVTKDGNVAGPRVLEHMVDAVLYFEGDRYASYESCAVSKTVSAPLMKSGSSRCAETVFRKSSIRPEFL